MNNADMPMAPIFDKRGDTESFDQVGVKFNGLTKLEHFTALAIQGICVNAGRNGLEFHEPKDIAVKAIEIAQAALQQLEGGEDE